MKKIIYYSWIIVLPFLTSCFEIIEEIKLNDDNTGTFKLTANLSNSRDQLNKIFQQDSIQGKKIPTTVEIESQIDALVEKLESYSGFSNVSTKKDFENYLFNIQFTFDDINNIDAGVKEILSTFNVDKNITDRFQLIKESKTIKRIIAPSLISDANESLGNWGKQEFKDVQIVNVLRMPTPIISYTNKKCMLSKSKKSLLLKTNLFDILNNTTSLENEITF